MININIDFLNKCVLGASTDNTRYYLQGVNIQDIDGWRHYCGTNGHILIHCKETIEPDDEGLPEPITLKMDKPIADKFNGHTNMILNTKEMFATFKLSKITSLAIIDGAYPDYFKVIPNNPSEPTEFSFFDWHYLQTVEKVLGKFEKTYAILQDNADAPAVFTRADVEGVEVVIMPIRLKVGA